MDSHRAEAAGRVPVHFALLYRPAGPLYRVARKRGRQKPTVPENPGAVGSGRQDELNSRQFKALSNLHRIRLRSKVRIEKQLIGNSF